MAGNGKTTTTREEIAWLTPEAKQLLDPRILPQDRLVKLNAQEKPMSAPVSAGKKKRKKSRIRQLKVEKRKLKKQMREAKKEIKSDSKQKEAEDYTPYENRQRLAKVSSELQSKMERLSLEIGVRKDIKKEKKKMMVKTKVQKKYVRAAHQHQRLLKLTTKLEKIKNEEETLRAEIIQNQKVIHNPEAAKELTDLDNKPEFSAQELSEEESDSDSDIADNPKRNARSMSALEFKEYRADKLSHKYEMTRDLRNIIHEHMITRSYSYSYFNIIPPYKRKPKKEEKVKQYFNRLVYEDKISIRDVHEKFGHKATSAYGQRGVTLPL